MLQLRSPLFRDAGVVKLSKAKMTTGGIAEICGFRTSLSLPLIALSVAKTVNIRKTEIHF